MSSHRVLIVVHMMTTRAESDWELGKMYGEIGELLTARHQSIAASDLPVEGMLPSFDGANRWLNSEPLTQGALRGHLVVVQFWTYACINWLRTQAHFRAWSQRYRDQGLDTIGVHTPEFKFEHDLDNVRWAMEARKTYR